MYQFSFLNGSKEMQNLIRIALKWLFFSEILPNFAQQLGFCRKTPVCDCRDRWHLARVQPLISRILHVY